jgi:hypothetical protein
MEFKMTKEETSTISFLDLQIKRNQKQLMINIYRKPTTTDTTIHYKSNHPMEHKLLAAYRFLLNRLHQLPLTQENKRHEMNTIFQIAKKNDYPLVIINQLNKTIMNKKQNTTQDTIQTKRYDKWITFEYHSRLIRKVTSIFRNTNLRIMFRVNNTISNHLRNQKRNIDRYENSGIYSIKCNTCEKRCVGQNGRNLKARFLEHQRYIKTNNPKSAYALHILNNRHEYGTLHSTMELLKSCKKGWCMNALENYYIQWYQHKVSLIQEQDVGEINTLFSLVFATSHNRHAPSNTPNP